MTAVFINYRSRDEETVAALLERALSERFTSEVFFRASKSITPGDDWRHELLRGVRTSSVLLAVIGPRWLTVHKDKTRRIDQESDWVRRVIPVLIGDTPRLEEDQLPAPLRQLASCQYIRVRSRDMEADFERLARVLTEVVPELREDQIAPPETGSVTNNAFGNARVGMQAGTIIGDVNFGGFMNRNDR
jgi:TIR domain-containing protein